MKRTNILFKSFTAFIIALAMVSCEIDSFSEESQFEFGDITAPSNLTLSAEIVGGGTGDGSGTCLLYTSPSPRDATLSRMPSSA